MRYFLTFAVAALLALTATGSGKTGVAYADVDTSLRGSYDQLVIGALGINAPVNVRNVGDDGQMGEPAGKDDVVRYDFPTFPWVGGYPGSGGTTVVAGHVDYHPHFEAVFWTLRQATPGMQIDYYRGDGAVVSYVVDWLRSIGGDDNFADYLTASDPETIVLVSCEGSFDPTTRHYNNRTMVHGVRIA